MADTNPQDIMKLLLESANSQKTYADKLRETRESRAKELNQFQDQVNTTGDFQTPGGIPLNPQDVVNAKSLFAKSMAGALSPYSPELEQKAMTSNSDLLTQIYQLQQKDAETNKEKTGTVDDLLNTRKKLEDAGLDTSIIDKELEAKGLGKKVITQDVISQINSLKGSDKTGARAVKDILDVVDRAQAKFDELNKGGIGKAFKGEGTGPLSAVASLVGKTAGGVPKTEQLNKELNEILRTIRKESTGVAFSPEEIKALLNEIPSIWQQEGNVSDSLIRLKQRMVEKLTNYGIDTANRSSSSTTQTNDVGDFDVEGALNAGYTLDEIKGFIGAK